MGCAIPTLVSTKSALYGELWYDTFLGYEKTAVIKQAWLKNTTKGENFSDAQTASDGLYDTCDLEVLAQYILYNEFW